LRKGKKRKKGEKTKEGGGEESRGEKRKKVGKKSRLEGLFCELVMAFVGLHHQHQRDFAQKKEKKERGVGEKEK